LKSINKVYIDVCTLCRPFDDQDVMRIRLETDAYYLILQAIQNKKYEMVVSPVHLEEINAIEDVQERYEILALIKRFGVTAKCNLSKTRERAEYFYSKKLGVADSAHLAFAEATADFFITCDDKLINKCHKIPIQLDIANPVGFAAKEDLK
jgi:predicted nucleic acid-binding protein